MPPKITLSRRKVCVAPTSDIEEDPPEIIDITQDDIRDNDNDFVRPRCPGRLSKVNLGKRIKLSTASSASGSPSSFPNRFKTSSADSLETKAKPQKTSQEPTTVTSRPSSSSSKISNIKKLEAMARATSKLKQEFASAQTTDKECLPWVERNFPENVDQLFVHKKKVMDVKQWMEQAFNRYSNAHTTSTSSYNVSKMCLLTGPSGSGKTATACLIAKELDGEVKEWINPMTLTQFTQGRFDGDEIQGRSQLDLFSDFLLRSSQYHSLPMKGRKQFSNRLVIVEDFPNMFYRDTQVFHNILRNYNTTGQSPVIFIVADNASGEFNPIKLFPKQIIQELKITQFSFNAVAPSLMNKFLTVVCNRENVSVDQSVLEGITAASAGDIRCAINTLQFKILKEKPTTKDGFKRPFPRPAKLKKDKMFKSQDLTNKDESLFLFRALGKVLYNKREPKENVTELELVDRLAEERRPNASQEIPEEITNKIEVSTETFLGFLHQNYGNFFGSIENCSKAAGYLSYAEVLLSRWNFGDISNSGGSKSYKSQDTRSKIGLSVAVRGLMHANTVKVSSQWRPLRKPLCGDIYLKTQQNFDRAKALFPALISNVQDFYYDNIPMYAKNTGRNSILNSEQHMFVRELGLYRDSKQFNKPQWTETLDEKFAVVYDDEDGNADAESDHDSLESRPENGSGVGSSNKDPNELPGTRTGIGSSVAAAPLLVQVQSVDTKVEESEGTVEDFQIDEFEDDDW